MRLTAQVLGPLGAMVGDRPVDLGGPRLRRLFALLVAASGSVVSTDRLIDAVWEGSPPDGARQTFRTYIARLRRSLEAAGLEDGGSVILTGPSGYALGTSQLSCDATSFERAVSEARDALDVGESRAALTQLDEALSWWRGAAYGEFADEEWARPEAVRLEELRIVARELRVRALLDLGLHAEVVPELEALTTTYPLREGPRRQLMVALYRSGRHAEALRVGRAFAELLADETGLDTTAEFREVEQMILDRDPRLDVRPPGRKLRGYQLEERLGSGASGATYRASQVSVGREVAITVLPPELADDPRFVQTFEVRAQLVARLEHPHIVPLYDYWREPGGAYLVMRYLPGRSLRHRLIEQGPMSWEESVEVLTPIADAVAAAHQRGVVHGSLDPSHVLFDERGTPYLGGFGMGQADDLVATDIAGLARLTMAMLRGVGARARPGDGATHDPSDPFVASHPVLQEVLLRATDATAPNPFGSVREFRDALHVAVGSRPVTGARGAGGEPAIEGPNPYKGLHAFTETDAADFFGRAALVDDLVAHLAHARFVAVVGPSGSGKSSVVRAGLLPRLRATGAFLATMVPGSRPLAELEIALTRVAAVPVPHLASELEQDAGGLAATVRRILPEGHTPLYLVIDQFEELFTLSDAAGRERFLASIERALQEQHGRLRVIVTARADFLGRLLDHPAVGRLVRDNVRLVTPLQPDDLHEAIVGPAERAGVVVEPALATALVADALGSPGSLPLLQYALTEIYERREGGVMTLAAYRGLGGMSAVLAQRAEEIYSSLAPDDQDGVRRLFSRLVTPGDGVDDTRRRALRSELASVSGSVIEAYGDARLLSFDRDPVSREPTVELAHEALIREWPRLQGWIDEDRDGLRVLRHLHAAAIGWDTAGRDPGELYRGGRLDAARGWVEDHPGQLSDTESAFLDASREADEAERARERRTVRRLRRLVTAVALVAVVAVVASVLALVSREAAAESATEADLRFLVAESKDQVESDRSRGLLMAVEAHRLSDGSVEGLGAVQRALLGVPRGWLGDLVTGRQYRDIAFLSDEMFAAATEAGIELWDLDSRQIVSQREVPGGVRSLSASPGGSALAVAVGGGWAVVDPATLEDVHAEIERAQVTKVVFGPSADVVAVGLADGGVILHDLAQGERHELPGLTAAVYELAVSPEGDLVTATAGRTRYEARQWRRSGEQVGGELATGSVIAPVLARYVGDQLYLADLNVRAYTADTGEPAGEPVVLDIGISTNGDLHALPDGTLLLTGETGIERFDPETGTVDVVLSATPLETLAGGSAVSPDGAVVATAGAAGISFWATDGAGALVDVVLPRLGELAHISPDGDTVVDSSTFPGEGGSRIWDLSGPDPRPVAEFPDVAWTRIAGEFPVSFGSEEPVAPGTVPDAFRYDLVDYRDGTSERLTPPGYDGVGSFSPVALDGGRTVVIPRNNDGLVDVFERGTQRQVARLEPISPPDQRQWVLDAEVAPDGRTLIVADEASGRVGFYDTTTWELRDVFDAEDGFVEIAFSADGRTVVTHRPDRGLERRDPDDLRRVIAGPVAAPSTYFGRTTELSSDGRLVKTSSESGVQLWDAQTLAPLGAPFPQDWGPGTYAADAGRMVTVLGDEVIVWRIEPDSWVDQACLLAGRNLTAAEWDRYGPRGPYRETCDRW